MAETSGRPTVLSLSCAMTIRHGLSALRASSRAQFGDRPRDRTPNRSCDVAASGACRCWPTNLPTIWSASGIRPSAVGDAPPKRLRTAQAGSEPKLWLGPAALRRRLSITARTGPRRAADLPQRRSALPQTSWREFGEFRDSCGTALSCDKTISPLSLSIPGLRVCSISGLGLRFAGYRFGGDVVTS